MSTDIAESRVTSSRFVACVNALGYLSGHWAGEHSGRPAGAGVVSVDARLAVSSITGQPPPDGGGGAGTAAGGLTTARSAQNENDTAGRGTEISRGRGPSEEYGEVDQAEDGLIGDDAAA